jgi:hypothetical protein
MKKVYIETLTNVFEMSVDEFSRWMCLVEAFDFIEKKAQDLGVDPDDLLKPLAIEEYIHGSIPKKFDGRFESMRHDVKCELEMGFL